jgi:molybdenum cofactor biosynthesis enzyme MoaA
MTSNGQFDDELLGDINKEGLKSINFSILSLNPDQFLETQIYKSPDWAKSSVEKLCLSIIKAKELNMSVKANTVINSKLDYERVDQILKFCGELDMTLVLLNNVSLGKESEDAVFDYVKLKKGILISTKEPSSNSRGKKTYLLPSGETIEAKYFRNYFPDMVCRNCKNRATEACLEKYYGVRVELRDEFYARLCIQESNEKTLMPLKDFFIKDIYRNLN